MSKSGERATLSIGDLAEATGVSAATLRVWEARHGFPVPHRLDSGHRRYDDEHVAVVRDVQKRRDDGVRLDVAIEQALAAREESDPVAEPTPSVYARLRQTHPGLQPLRLTKGTLLGLSWAIEDEFAARAHRSHLFGAFQRTPHYRSAEARWNDLARTMGCTFVFADFPAGSASAPPEPGKPIKVSVPSHHPMAREWAVVCDNPQLPVALTAWELPGQERVRDADRVFESVWTVEQSAVREAALVCARTAAVLGAPGAVGVAAELDRPAGKGHADLAQVTSLFNRVVSYVDNRAVVHP